MRVVIYSKVVSNVSGVQTFELALMQLLKEQGHEIIFMFDNIADQIREVFSEYATVVPNDGRLIECDICIYSSIVHRKNKIKARKYVQMVHADISHWDIRYDPKGIDQHIAVSPLVQSKLKEFYNIDSIVIPNLIPVMNFDKVIRFVTISRIYHGKGFERMLEFVKRLKQENRKFIWEIYGEGSGMYEEQIRALFRPYSEVKFMGAKLNVFSWFLNAVDYVVQLSDSEGYCYSIAQAIDYGIPVIVNNWEGVSERVKDGNNGFIIDKDLSNLDLNKIYNQKPTFVPNWYWKSEVEEIKQLWQNVLSN